MALPHGGIIVLAQFAQLPCRGALSWPPPFADLVHETSQFQETGYVEERPSLGQLQKRIGGRDVRPFRRKDVNRS